MQKLIATIFVLSLLNACQPAGDTTPRPTAPPTVLFQLGQVTVKPSAEPATPTVPLPTLTATPNNLPDLSGQSISLIFLCDRSGQFAAADASRVAGAQDMVAHINGNGGIFGAQLDLKFGDTQGTVEGAQRAEARLLRESPEASLIIICDAASEGALASTLSDDEIPALTPGEFAEPSGFIFGLDAAPGQQFSFWLTDLVENWANHKPDGAGTEIRLAFLSWPAELAGPIVTPADLAYAESLGVQVVMQIELAPDETDEIFDFIYAARDEGVNAIYTNTRSTSLAALLNGVGNLGLQGRFVIGASAAAYDNDLYSYISDPSFPSGLYLTSSWSWWSDANTPGVQFAQDLLAGSSFKPEWADWGYLQMAGAVDIARAAFEGAILENGFEELNPETIFAALQDLDSYAVLGGVCLIDYSSDSRSPNQLAVWQVGAAPGELSVITSLSPIPTLVPTP